MKPKKTTPGSRSPRAQKLPPRKPKAGKTGIDALGFSSWLYSGAGKRVTLCEVLILLNGERGKRRTGEEGC